MSVASNDTNVSDRGLAEAATLSHSETRQNEPLEERRCPSSLHTRPGPRPSRFQNMRASLSCSRHWTPNNSWTVLISYPFSKVLIWCHPLAVRSGFAYLILLLPTPFLAPNSSSISDLATSPPHKSSARKATSASVTLRVRVSPCF